MNFVDFEIKMSKARLQRDCILPNKHQLMGSQVKVRDNIFWESKRHTSGWLMLKDLAFTHRTCTLTVIIVQIAPLGCVGPHSWLMQSLAATLLGFTWDQFLYFIIIIIIVNIFKVAWIMKLLLGPHRYRRRIHSLEVKWQCQGMSARTEMS